MRLRSALAGGALIVSMLASSFATTLPAGAAGTDATQVAITQAKAEKLAKAGVLTTKDLKTFRSEPYEEDSPEYIADFYGCLGAKPPKYLAKNPGRSFDKRALTIDSSAYVVNTPKAAKADFRAVMTKKGDSCLARAFRFAFEQEGATVDSIKVRRFALSIPGTDLAFGQRYVMSGSFDGFPFAVVGLTLNALVGQTQMSVGPTRYDGREPSLTQATSLVNKVVQRVRAL
jgi:hypothetical protein